MSAATVRGAVPAAKANPVPPGGSVGTGGARPPTLLESLPRYRFGVRICGWAVEAGFMALASAERYAIASARHYGWGFELVDLQSGVIIKVVLP